MHSQEQFLLALDNLRNRINSACARCRRSPHEVELMAVTKTHPLEAVEWAAAAGLRCVGENRVQEAAQKRSDKGPLIRWELIGPLQSNKARLAMQTFGRIQTVDRPKLVGILDRICEEEGIGKYPLMLQVNVGEDPAKHGCPTMEAEALARAVLSSRHLVLDGLMTIGELSSDEAVVRGTFARLRDLRDNLAKRLGCDLPELSMGMTDDLEWAIEEGSTMIRVGTALFGYRGPYSPSS